MKRMYEDGEDAIYYITVDNENYAIRRCPRAARKASSAACTSSRPSDAGAKRPHVQLFGSGAILREALRAQEILAEKYRRVEQRLERDQLHRAAPRRAGRRALEHAASRPSKPRAVVRRASARPARQGRSSPRRTTCGPWPSRSARGCPAGCSRWAPTASAAARAARHLRRHFEVDAECIAVAALYQLAKQGHVEPKCRCRGDQELGHRPGKDRPGASMKPSVTTWPSYNCNLPTTVPDASAAQHGP